MKKPVLAKLLAMTAFAVFFCGHAHAGFTISVKPLAKATPAPAAAPTPVVVTPVAASVAAPLVQLKVGKGESLQAATKTFLSQFGWTPAWMAGDVLAGDAMTFYGKDHEEALASFLRHYNLIGERFVAEKGYVIRRSSESGAK
jgi:hypothetical protein